MRKFGIVLGCAATFVLAACASDVIGDEWWEAMTAFYNQQQGTKALVLNVTQEYGDTFDYAYYVSSARASKVDACIEALKSCVQATQDNSNLKPGGCRIIAVNDKWNATRDDFSYDNGKTMAILSGFAAGMSNAAAQYGQPVQSYQLRLESEEAAAQYNSRGAFDPKTLPADCH